MEETEQEEYYLAIQENGETILYKSELYVLNELDIINLIKICLVQKRAVSLGKKILNVYKDVTKHKEEETLKILKKIGLNLQNNNPERTKKIKNR